MRRGWAGKVKLREVKRLGLDLSVLQKVVAELELETRCFANFTVI